MLTTEQFIDSLGINTHIDSRHAKDEAYSHTATVVSALKYLGIKNLRDCPTKPVTLEMWRTIQHATGAKFLVYLPSGSPSDIVRSYGFLNSIYRAGLLDLYEGPNEPDIGYSIQNGGSIGFATEFVRSVLTPLARERKKAVVNISVGGGWNPADGYKGNYDAIGNMDGVADFANAHTYPTPAQKTTATMTRLNALANISMPGRMVMTTEIGWKEEDGHKPDDVARYVLQAAFAGTLLNTARTYFYGLFDDQSGRFGLMNSDGTPKPAGSALHNMVKLLKTPQKSTAPLESLSVAISGGLPTDCRVWLVDPAGGRWLAIWNEVAEPRDVTLTFSQPVSAKAYMPRVGTVGMPKSENGKVSFAMSSDVVLIATT